MNALNIGRIKLAVAALDAERRLINVSTNYANERIQFGKKISEFGAIKEKIALMATDLYVGESSSKFYKWFKVEKSKLAKIFNYHYVS